MIKTTLKDILTIIGVILLIAFIGFQIGVWWTYTFNVNGKIYSALNVANTTIHELTKNCTFYLESCRESCKSELVELGVYCKSQLESCKSDLLWQLNISDKWEEIAVNCTDWVHKLAD